MHRGELLVGFLLGADALDVRNLGKRYEAADAEDVNDEAATIVVNDLALDRLTGLEHLL